MPLFWWHWLCFIFLGDWRSTLIPTLAVPISLIGAFIFMQAFGLTINMITLFAIVLAIGIVVDDAIVVVEAVHAKMEAEHLSPYRAVQKYWEISGAVIAITLLMTAVFVFPLPLCRGQWVCSIASFHHHGSAPLFFRVGSAYAYTGSLRHDFEEHPRKAERNLFNRFIDAFNHGFEKITNKYVGLLQRIAHRKWITVGLWFAFGGGIPGHYKFSSVWLYSQWRSGDDLRHRANTSRFNTGAHQWHLAPTARSWWRLRTINRSLPLQAMKWLTEGRGSNAGTCLINLKPWDEREAYRTEIIYELEEKAKELPGATIEFFDPPAVPSFGATGGFTLQLLDKILTVPTMI